MPVDACLTSAPFHICTAEGLWTIRSISTCLSTHAAHSRRISRADVFTNSVDHLSEGWDMVEQIYCILVCTSLFVHINPNHLPSPGSVGLFKNQSTLPEALRNHISSWRMPFCCWFVDISLLTPWYLYFSILTVNNTTTSCSTRFSCRFHIGLKWG